MLRQFENFQNACYIILIIFQLVFVNNNLFSILLKISFNSFSIWNIFLFFLESKSNACFRQFLWNSFCWQKDADIDGVILDNELNSYITSVCRRVLVAGSLTDSQLKSLCMSKRQIEEKQQQRESGRHEGRECLIEKKIERDMGRFSEIEREWVEKRERERKSVS